MDSTIQDFVKSKRLAVAGVSRSGKKFGNMIYTELKQRGYQVYAVHPEAAEIGGDKCYPNFSALPGGIDGVVICVSPRQSEKVLREAVQAGIKKVWLQQGAQSPEALAAAKELGVSTVDGKCLLMYAEPVSSFHKFHRFFAKLFGQY